MCWAVQGAVQQKTDSAFPPHMGGRHQSCPHPNSGEKISTKGKGGVAGDECEGPVPSPICENECECLVKEGQILTAKADRRKKDLRSPCHLEPNLALSAKLLVNKSIWTRILNTREGSFLGYLHLLPDAQFRKEENKRERGRKCTLAFGSILHSAGQPGAQHPDLSPQVFCTDRPAHSSEAGGLGVCRKSKGEKSRQKQTEQPLEG